MSKYKIALLDGDGIGPETMVEAVKVLKLVEERNDVEFELIHEPFGASAYSSAVIHSRSKPRKSAMRRTQSSRDQLD